MTTMTVFENRDQTASKVVAVLTRRKTVLSVNAASSPGWVKKSEAAMQFGSLAAATIYGTVTTFLNTNATESETLVVDSTVDTDVAGVVDMGNTFYTSAGQSFTY